jgi:ArsR family transcriptional regulator
MRDVVRILDVLADPVRLRLLRLLRNQELCVCELVDVLRLPQYAISRHLRPLRALGVVTARRDGRWMHYRLGPQAKGRGAWVDLISVLIRQLDGRPLARRDDVSLARRLALGRVGRCVTQGNGRMVRRSPTHASEARDE